MKFLLLFKKENSKMQRYWWHRILIVIFLVITPLLYLGSFISLNEYDSQKRSDCISEHVRVQQKEILESSFNQAVERQRSLPPSAPLIDWIESEYGIGSPITPPQPSYELAMAECEKEYPSSVSFNLFLSIFITYFIVILTQLLYFRLIIPTISYIIFSNSSQLLNG